MENIYILMLVALGFLAIIDLVVGVSNDAVNFLNSAIGSKALKFSTILIVASAGILIGSIFSNGMMEVARNKIFNPEMFVFSEIMIIFMAVMITDVLLLDFFNNLGLPTSTTVSVVFELLGASFVVTLIKISGNNLSYDTISQYIDFSESSRIVVSIVLSVAIAFSVGLIVQWLSRLLMTFNYKHKPEWVTTLFATICLTTFNYFIVIKGIKGTSFASEIYSFTQGMPLGEYLLTINLEIVIGSFLFWAIFSYLLIHFLRFNIYKLIIAIGTFALALAFAGNDLVNFIGVPIAAYQSYGFWHESGIAANQFAMTQLTGKVNTPFLFLILAGMIMVITLFTSKKARSVTETEINLAREGESNEKFEPNFLSRFLVRGASFISETIYQIIPDSWKATIEKRFQKPVIHLSKEKQYQLPAFDTIRASINLMTAASIIAFATSSKLPLSTTYVTFMVAMGTSLADRAWGAESAVYRVAGVLNVIAGWFITAIVAFISAGVVAYLIHLGGNFMVAVLILLTLLLLVRNYIAFRKRGNKTMIEDEIKKSESRSIKGVIDESAENIANVIKRSNKVYVNDINGLTQANLQLLKKNKKQVNKLVDEIDALRDNIFYFIKNQEDTTMQASNFYIRIMSELEDMAQSLERISKISLKHINNNHKKLKENQIKDLQEVEGWISNLFSDIKESFSNKDLNSIQNILKEKNSFLVNIEKKIENQIERTRKEETSPKNTTLYFSILLESKDLVEATFNLLDEYKKNYQS